MTLKENEKKNDSRPLMGRPVPVATENEIFVHAVSTNEEAEAVPVAVSTTLPPKQSFDEQPRHSPQTYTIQDSGEFIPSQQIHCLTMNETYPLFL